MSPEIMNKILEEACQWQARLSAEDCTDQERLAHEAWCALSEHHQRSAARVAALYNDLGMLAPATPRLQALARSHSQSVKVVSLPTADRVMGHDPAPQSWRWSRMALAACVPLLLALTLILQRPAMVPGPEYMTRSGEIREILLEDGSVVRLDGNSTVRVSMDAGRRRIDLLQGRAVFEVAHDPARPFSVVAGDNEVVAIGTRFQVEIDRHELLVTLDEGIVDVIDNTDAVDIGRLAPGEQMIIRQTPRRTHEVQPVDSAAVTAWTRGRHVFRDVFLGDAVEEVNRYVSKPIRLADPVLAGLPVSGNFILGESGSVVQAFAAALNLRLVDTGSEFLLFASAP